METIRKTKHEILDEVAAHYNNLNRSVTRHEDDSTYKCLYNGPDGKKCAMAYLCEDNTPFEEGEAAERFISFVKPEYAGYDIEFYNDIQRLHDNDRYWTNEGLSLEGKRLVSRLKNLWLN